MDRETSFIPKQTLDNNSSVERPISLLAVISTFVFVGALIGSVGVFFYQKKLNTDITNLNLALEEKKKELLPEKIVELKKLDDRLKSLNSLVKNHTVTSPLFDLIESVTTKSVSFNKFGFLYFVNQGDISQTKKIKVTLPGVSKNYLSIALQAEALNDNPSIKNPVFSDFKLDQSGNVSFSLDFEVDPSVFSYDKNFVGSAENINLQNN